jgi:hypothetical protein
MAQATSSTAFHDPRSRLLKDDAYAFRIQTGERNNVVVYRDYITLIGFVKIEINVTFAEQGRDHDIDFSHSKVHADAVARSARERHKVARHLRCDIGEPPFRDKVTRVRKDVGVRVLEIGCHANGHLAGSAASEITSDSRTGEVHLPLLGSSTSYHLPDSYIEVLRLARYEATDAWSRSCDCAVNQHRLKYHLVKLTAGLP